MKKLLNLFLLILIISFTTILFSCGLSVTPFAYVTFKLNDNQIAYHDSSMYGTHIYIFEDQNKMPDGTLDKYKDNHAGFLVDCDSNAMATISFNSILGVENVDGVRCTLVNLESWYYVQLTVKKDSVMYDANKSLYLNNTLLTKTDKYDNIYDADGLVKFHFENCNLVRSNPNGKINNYVNLLEYK